MLATPGGTSTACINTNAGNPWRNDACLHQYSCWQPLEERALLASILMLATPGGRHGAARRHKRPALRTATIAATVEHGPSGTACPEGPSRTESKDERKQSA